MFPNITSKKFASYTAKFTFLIAFIVSTNCSFAQSWNNVGNTGFSDGAAWFPSIAISASGEPYVAYQDEKNNDWVTVSKYNGSTWSPVGMPGFSGREVINSTILINKAGVPYIAFADKYYQGKASIMNLVDGNWEYVGADRFTDGQANFLSFALDNNSIPYVAFSQYDSVFSLAVMKFDGTNWISVGNTDFAETNVVNTSIRFDKNNVLYLAYNDGPNDMKGTVRKYNGTDWVLAGNGAFTPAAANFLSLCINDDNIPYVSFSSGAKSKASVMKLNGAKWEFVGEKEFTSGEAYQISLVLTKKSVPGITYTDSSYLPGTMTFSNDLWESNNLGLFTEGVAFNTSYTLDNAGQSYFAYIDNNSGGGSSVMKLSKVLPVLLLDFTGKAVNNTSQLSWSTSSESNNDRFDLERSADGINFKTIGSVKGHGTTSSKYHYNYTDNSPILGAINYYRLNQKDFDGQSYLSKVVSLQFANEVSKISLYPNPARDILNLKIENNNQTLTLKIFSANGQLQWSQKYANPTQIIQVPVSKLASGAYHITVEKANGDKQSISFIKE